jgi:predicted DNA-binding transcriptional regulator AlpA
MERKYPEIMTMEQLCDYLQVKRNIIYGFLEEGLPWFPLTKSENSHKRFLKKKVDEWLSNRNTNA